MKWNVTRRITLGFGLVLVLLLGVAVMGIVALRIERTRYEEALEHQREVLVEAAGMAQIRQAMANIQEATQQNLASTRQAERAANDLNELGGRLVALVGTNGRPTPSAARAWEGR